MSDETPVPTTHVSTAIIRTLVPYLTVFLVAKAAEWGINLDSQEVSGAIVLVGGSFWYAIISNLEKRYPQVGWLLGSPTAPKYDK